MSDLISREAVEKAIKDYFKMIIDKTEDDIFCVLDYNKQICTIISEIPISYDVDKVVEQLEENCWKDRDNIDLPGIDLDKAIELVKAGGKE